MPKRFQSFSKDELRELHLALALRITQLTTMDPQDMDKSDTAKVKRQLDLTKDLHSEVQKARGK
jgi:hypothetical protein